MLDLLSLSEDWSVDSLKVYLLNLIENDEDQILTCLRYAIESGHETDEYESRARRRFCELLDHDELYELPIVILKRIVDIGLQDTNFDKLFVFLIRCLDRFGSCGSIVFQGIKVSHFSISQVEELKTRRCFVWCFLSDTICDTLSHCMIEMAEHRNRIESEHEELCELQREYRRVISEYETGQRTQKDLESRLCSVESSLAAFKSSVEGRLDLIESTNVSKSEAEGKYAHKSDLATNYATKSELSTNYTTKSELETKYATKSDLQSNYFTKSDAKSLELRCASKASVEEELKFLKRVTRSFPAIAGSPLNGIIHHLTLEFGGNVHDRGIVSITADRPYGDSPSYAAKNIADLEANSYFDCANAKDMWVCYDFKTMKVILTDYAIRSRYNHNGHNLKSWVIEVSNDGSHWTEADRRENRDDLCATNVVRSFAVSKPTVGRYIRLRQTGFNNHGDFDTYISGFELFGSLTA
jgi:hypothetical protein